MPGENPEQSYLVKLQVEREDAIREWVSSLPITPESVSQIKLSFLYDDSSQLGATIVPKPHEPTSRKRKYLRSINPTLIGAAFYLIARYACHAWLNPKDEASVLTSFCLGAIATGFAISALAVFNKKG